MEEFGYCNKSLPDNIREYVGERGAKRARERVRADESSTLRREYAELFLGCFRDRKKRKAVSGLLELTSCLHLSRNDVYESVMKNLQARLLASLRNADESVLSQILEESIEFLGVKDLEQIPQDILKVHTTVPIMLLKRIKRDRPNVFEALPERTKIRAENGNERKEIARLVRLYADQYTKLRGEAVTTDDIISLPSNRSIRSTLRQLVSILKEIPGTEDAARAVLRQEYVKSSNSILCDLRNNLFHDTKEEMLARKVNDYIAKGNRALVSELANQLRETYEPVRKYLDYQSSKRDVNSRSKSSPPVKMLLHALKDIQTFDSQLVFAQPPSREIPRYYDIITTPMDLSTVRKNVESEKYQDVKSFAKDIEQISINCTRFNGKTSYYGKYGKTFGDKCKRVLKQLKDAETSRHETEHQRALAEFHKNTKMPPVPQIEDLQSLSKISFAVAAPRFVKVVIRHALQLSCSETDREMILSEDERILLQFGVHAREHLKHYDLRSMHMLPPCFEIPPRSSSLDRALRVLVSTTPESFEKNEHSVLVKSCMETSPVFRVFIFRLILLRLKEPRPKYVKYALTHYVLPFAKTRFDMRMNFFLSEREAWIEIVDFILNTLSSSNSAELIFQQCCAHVRNVTEFFLKLLLMCGEQDADTVNHAHAQLSRLLLGYSECCTSDQRNELNRWVKRASTLWSTIEDRSKDERTARVYADLLLKNSL